MVQEVPEGAVIPPTMGYSGSSVGVGAGPWLSVAYFR